MSQYNKNWLPHLINAIPEKGYGKKLSSVSIALEAWRRGLSVEFYQEDNPENKLRIRYKISNGINTHRFFSSMGDKVTQEAFDICDNKFLTKTYLERKGVPTPQGKMFGVNDTKQTIIEYVDKIGYPIVLKPTNANGGRGVFSNLKNPLSVNKAIDHIRNNLGYQEILIEQYVPGDEYRVIVIDNKVVGALNRIPANVNGNGKNTIRELIRKKNNERRQNPH